MRNATGDVWPRVLKVIGSLLLLVTTCCAQNPAPAPTPPVQANNPGYQDPLPQDTGSAGLKQALRKLQTTGRLMQVVAHPDDEDGGMLTLEARGKGVQTLLLTLTRGEGGQNKLGSSLFDVLGVLRTLELLAADRYYGVEQRFTRVADFGYSKTADETFEKWGGHNVALADIVRVIREFHPDVLVARFSGTENDGHGHHQASAILTREAFRAAADPNRFPEQIKEGLQPWQAKKLYIGNVCGFGASTCADEKWTVKLNTGEEDPALGMSYVQFAIQGLRHQESQGLGELRIPAGPRYGFYKLVDSVLPNTKDSSGHEKDFFDGIDTSLPGLAVRLGEEEKGVPWLRGDLQKIADQMKTAQEASGQDTSLAAQPLLQTVRLFKTAGHRLEASSVSMPLKLQLLSRLEQENEQSGKALNLALNVSVSAVVQEPRAGVTQGQSVAGISHGQQVAVRVALHNGSKYPLTIEKTQLEKMGVELGPGLGPKIAPPGQDYEEDIRLSVPSAVEYTRPYWHRNNPEEDSVNIVDDPKYATLPFPPSPLHVRLEYSLASQNQASNVSKTRPDPHFGVAVSVPVLEPFLDERGEKRQQVLAILPEFSVAVEPGEQVVPVQDGKERTVKVGVSSNITGAPAGALHLDLPSGWRSEPANLRVNLTKRGDRQDFEFKVFPADLKEGRAQIRAVLDVGGKKYSEGYTLVTREDLGSAYYFQPAIQRISIVDVKVPKDLKVGYILGAGDDIPTVLPQIGVNLTLIPAEKLATKNLSQYGTVVLGIRTYDTQKGVAADNQKLLDYASNGGTLVVQYNTGVSDFNNGHFTPYPAELSRARVSVEEAPMQILAPDDSVFHYPNEISQKDFDGWLQERGLYFMDKWDDHFKPLLACHDPNEPDQKGGLLVAKYGKGTYIYTGYAFFRQLPAGVPGAVRLFVNLLAAGHQSAP